MDVTELAILECINTIYQAAYDQAGWPIATEALRRLLQGSKACLVRMGPDRRPNDVVAPNNDPAFRDRYIAEFAHEPNIVETTVARVPVGSVYNDLNLIGRETLRSSRLWNEWMAPQDMYGGLTAKLGAAGPSTWFFDVQRSRSQPEFTGSDVELLKAIAPHLWRGIELSRSIRVARLFSATINDLPFGVLAVDRSQRVVSMNETAERILADSEAGLSLRMGVLVASDPLKNTQLQRFIAAACAVADTVDAGSGGDLVFAAPGAGSAPTLAVSIGPAPAGEPSAPSLEPCAIVILRRIAPDIPAGFVEELRRVFDLTPKEAAIAAGLAAGQSLKQIAGGASIQFSTARTHLERIFRKTGTRQQSQLVAVLKNVQIMLRRG